jgi:Transposase zinc-ribbon domain
MSEVEAENVFARLRWLQTDGKPVCPTCGCQVCYDCRCSPDRVRWHCKACRADFSVTSDTLFAWQNRSGCQRRWRLLHDAGLMHRR